MPLFLSRSLPGADAAVLALATAIGVTAGLAQAIGLLRWPFAVPYLARHPDEPGIGGLPGDPSAAPASASASTSATC